MDLRRLSAFLTVAEEGTLTAAAARLRLAQPGLSQQIHKLEHELGVELLDRSNPRRITLTRAGRTLAARGPELLRSVQHLEDEIRRVGAGLAGTLQISLTRSVGPGLPEEILRDYRGQHPHVELTVTSSYTALQLEQLAHGASDVALVRLPVENDEGLHTHALLEEPFLLALPAGHRLVACERVDRAELLGEPLVGWPRQQAPGFWDQLITHIYGPHTPQVSQTEPDEERLLAAVAACRGLGFVAESRSRSLREHGVCYRHLTDPEPTGTLGLAWRRCNDNPTLAEFLASATSAPAARTKTR